MHIQCHDALVTVLHHALLQDHPGVLWEQGITSSDHSHPGDIYCDKGNRGTPYHKRRAMTKSCREKAKPKDGCGIAFSQYAAAGM